MGRFRNTETGVVLSVDDSKDDRFTVGYEPADEPKKATKRTTSKPSKS